MRINFDLRRTGLGNNGGSQTLVKSANMLKELGHDVCIIDTGRSRYTWDPIKVDYHVVNRQNILPKGDVIMATGYSSVASTISAPPECGKKYHWIRGWETWRGDEQWIVKNILNVPTKKIVNSVGLKSRLRRYDIECEVVYPGYDFDKIYKIPKLKPHDSIILGGLYHNKHHEIKRVMWLFQTYEELKKRGHNVQLFLMGYDDLNSRFKCDFSVRNPTHEEKNAFYNTVDIWLSTSMQEGLHMPPAEAIMGGSCVVTTTAELSGTKDYIINGKTGIVTDNYLDAFINGVEALCKKPDLRKKLSENALNRIHEIGDRKKNMERLVSIFEKDI